MAKVFISYSSKDRPQALQIADELEKAGHTAWIDRKGIQGGTKWAEEIVQGITSSDFFLLLISQNSLSSDNVRKEIDLAAEEKKPSSRCALKPLMSFPLNSVITLSGCNMLMCLMQG